jgi:putative FmdB family regulatory protein
VEGGRRLTERREHADMPTYQYRCSECGHDLEAVQRFTDAALTECPNCGGQLRKVYNAVGVVFKGSGFYRTDSRKASSDNGSSEAAAASTTNGKESGDKSAPVKEKGSESGDKAPAKTASTSAATSSGSSSSTGSKAAGS